MRASTILVLIAAFLLTGACVTASPEAARIRATSDPQDVVGCDLLGTVTSVPPYIGPNDGVVQLKNNAAVLGADTLLLTSTGIARGKTGSAYRCGS